MEDKSLKAIFLYFVVGSRMAVFTKLLILFALSLAALAAQIPIMEGESYDSEMGTYDSEMGTYDSEMGTYPPPEGEVMTCTVTTSIADHRGRATWYEPGLGNCGWRNNRKQKVLAISKKLYDRNHGSNCGQWIEIVNNKNGKKSWGQTVDSCPGCGIDDLDLSPALFQDLGDLKAGVLSITWHFLPKFQSESL